MSAERQVPGGQYVNETGTRQAQIPGGPYVNETDSAGAGVTASPGAGTVTATGYAPWRSDFGAAGGLRLGRRY